MSQVVCRVAKLKTDVAIRSAGAHIMRTKATPNADPSKSNVSLLDGGDLTATIKARIAKAGATIRKDSVQAMEILLSASPEFFRPVKPEAYGQFDRARTKEWAKANMAMLRARYGDNLISAQLHLDEATPHIHAIIVPLTPSGRLSAKETFGRASLSKLQDAAAKCVSQLGIARGVRGSKAKHQDVAVYYTAVNESAAPTLPPSPAVPVPPLFGRGVWAERQTKRQAAHDAKTGRAVKKAFAQAAAMPRLKAEAAALKQTIAAKDKEIADMTEQLTKTQAAALRDVPLDRVLSAAGLDRGDMGRWTDAGRDILVDGAKWFDDAAPAKGRGSIDLVKHLNGCSYEAALGWLRDNVGQGAATRAVVALEAPSASQRVAAAPSPVFVPPQPNETRWAKVKAWLETVRALPAAVVDKLHAEGLVYADDRANAVFLMRGADNRPTGAELKGTLAKKPFVGAAPGTSRNAGQFSVGTPRPGGSVVVVEAAIDALSYAVLHSADKPHVVSTGGVRSTLPQLAEWAKDGRTLVVAYDADGPGNKHADRLIEAYRELGGQAVRVKPGLGAKDWNEQLTTRRDLSGAPPPPLPTKQAPTTKAADPAEVYRPRF